ncbi:MAG: LysM peptidoglycan-binding domain-containing protein [Alphaproteobacteria bacterium]|nr:LysM peptidoglycan-binding domain-containing protein [Planctomycetaceae bacterium]MCB1782560.1 LysM peptidoglycan-binding domain-containing protein [Alphaproteobacteria bacterium]
MSINANANRRTVEPDIKADAHALAQDAIEKARLRAEIQDKLERNPAVVDLLNRQAWEFTKHVDGDIQHKNFTAKEMVGAMDDVSVQALKDLSTRLDEISNCINNAPEKGLACVVFRDSAQDLTVTEPQADIEATLSAAAGRSEWEAETAKPAVIEISQSPEAAGQAATLEVAAGGELEGSKPELGAGVAQALASSHETSAPETVAQVPAEPKTDDYTVKAGDSLWKIAQNRGVPPSEFAGFRDQVATINGLENPDLIKPGMTLFIPEQQAVVAKVEASGPVATAPVQTPPSPAPVETKITGVVDFGAADISGASFDDASSATPMETDPAKLAHQAEIRAMEESMSGISGVKPAQPMEILTMGGDDPLAPSDAQVDTDPGLAQYSIKKGESLSVIAHCYYQNVEGMPQDYESIKAITEITAMHSGIDDINKVNQGQAITLIPAQQMLAEMQDYKSDPSKWQEVTAEQREANRAAQQDCDFCQAPSEKVTVMASAKM